MSAYYFYRGLRYRFITPDQLGPTFFHKKIWYFTHVLFALPVLIGGPIQFSARLRRSYPKVHRTLGKFYVFGVIVAALTAIYLGGVVGEYEARSTTWSAILLSALARTSWASECSTKAKSPGPRRRPSTSSMTDRRVPWNWLGTPRTIVMSVSQGARMSSSSTSSWMQFGPQFRIDKVLDGPAATHLRSVRR